MTRQNHALLALTAIVLGWTLVIFTIWRLYPEQSLARLMVTLGVGLAAWGLLWFPMEFLHRSFSSKGMDGRDHNQVMERIWRRSGWIALWISGLVVLFLQHAFRWEWSLLFGTFLLGAELLWMATEPSPKLGSLRRGRRRVGWD